MMTKRWRMSRAGPTAVEAGQREVQDEQVRRIGESPVECPGTVVDHFDDHFGGLLPDADRYARRTRVPADVGGRFAQAQRQRRLAIVR